jgi:hypothetical protein
MHDDPISLTVGIRDVIGSLARLCRDRSGLPCLDGGRRCVLNPAADRGCMIGPS